MLKLWYTTVLVALVQVCGAQEPSPPIVSTQTHATPERVQVYYGSQNVTLPELLPSQRALEPVDKCHGKPEGQVKLSLVVDSSGRPRNVIFDRPLGNELDQFALLILESDRFKPGTLNGAPVAIGRTVDMKLHACIERTTDSNGKKLETLHLRSWPEQKFEDSPQPQGEVTLAPIYGQHYTLNHLEKVGGSITPPKAIFQPEASYSDYARQQKIQGACILGLIVDAHGMPQKIYVAKTLEASLDEKAIQAVSRYRFTPAMWDGSPVPVQIAVEVRFRLYF